MLPWDDPSSGITPYLPTLMSPSVRPFPEGVARVPQPSGLACIQLRSNLPSRIIDRRSRTRSRVGLNGRLVVMDALRSRRRATTSGPVNARTVPVAEKPIDQSFRVPEWHGLDSVWLTPVRHDRWRARTLYRASALPYMRRFPWRSRR